MAKKRTVLDHDVLGRPQASSLEAQSVVVTAAVDVANPHVQTPVDVDAVIVAVDEVVDLEPP
ncbi:hypothetical protein NL529_34570, partial [Klebsiella pneumoniae]|nr:hypothetical protein [Klebsiella pneumoniae]